MSHDVSNLEDKTEVRQSRLPGVAIGKAHSLFPGLISSALLAWIGVWLSDLFGVTLLGFEKSPLSPVVLVIVLGLLVSNIVRLPASFGPGLRLAIQKILRLGIILLGIRLSVFDVFRLGALGVPIVLACIVGALLLTTYLNNRLGLPERLGTLIAVGTSICGASAIIAAGPTIDARDEEVSYAVAVISVFGIVAALVYPYLAFLLFAGDPVKSGLFLGTSIHETAQVAGAAVIFSDTFSLPAALDVATVTKMVRNVFMAIVIPAMAIHHARRTADQRAEEQRGSRVSKFLPRFIVGFLALAFVRSVGDAGINAGGRAFGTWDAEAWQSFYAFVNTWAGHLLVVALAGVGLNTDFRTLRELGIKPFLVGLGAALAVGGISFVAIFLLGSFVSL